MSPAFSPYAFLVYFVILWLGVTALLAYVSGWVELAKQFPDKDVHDGEIFHFASGAMGESKYFPVNYRNALMIAVSTEGLRISLFFLFRFWSPPIFIPWTAIDRIEEERLWLMKYSVIHLHQNPVRILLRGRVANHVLDQYQQRRPVIHRNSSPHNSNVAR